MDFSQRIYILGKQKQIVEQKVVCFLRNLTEVQKTVGQADLIVLIEKSKRLLVQLDQWEGCVLVTLSGKKLTLDKLNRECLLLRKMERLYFEYSSEYNEVLQRLLLYKKLNHPLSLKPVINKTLHIQDATKISKN